MRKVNREVLDAALEWQAAYEADEDDAVRGSVARARLSLAVDAMKRDARVRQWKKVLCLPTFGDATSAVPAEPQPATIVNNTVVKYGDGRVDDLLGGPMALRGEPVGFIPVKVRTEEESSGMNERSRQSDGSFVCDGVGAACSSSCDVSWPNFAALKASTNGKLTVLAWVADPRS